MKNLKHSDRELIRLNKYIAHSGMCSRREADKYIEDALVKVNGKIVTELGTKVHLNDKVSVNGKRIFPEKPVYIIMNKPKNCVSTTKDSNGRKTVIDLLGDIPMKRIYPVGRLDRNTTGVLLLTNDGELTKILTHPRYQLKKIYEVTLDTSLSKQDMNRIAGGIELEDGFIRADAIHYIDAQDLSRIGIEIHSGKNHIIRRIFHYFGYSIKKLDRVYFAGLTKKGLKRGQWRYLTNKEVHYLKMYSSGKLQIQGTSQRSK